MVLHVQYVPLKHIIYLLTQHNLLTVKQSPIRDGPYFTGEYSSCEKKGEYEISAKYFKLEIFKVDSHKQANATLHLGGIVD